MEYRQLGAHGLTVSSVGLGTRTWGLDTERHEAEEMLRAFVDAGGTLIQVETDPDYSEPGEVLGACLTGGIPRSALKIMLRSGFFPGRPPTGTASLASRGQLLDSFDETLRQLGTDHVDLWIATGPLSSVPVEEVLGAMDVAWRSGRARYIGIGDLDWWNAGASVALARSAGMELSAWGSEVSLLRPTVLSPGAAELRASGMGIIGGSPLAGGVLTGKYRHSTPPDARAASPRFRPEINRHLGGSRTIGVIEATIRAAEGLEHSPAQVALAWSRAVPGVASTIMGPRTTRQLDHMLEVADWRMPKALYDVLTEVATRG